MPEGTIDRLHGPRILGHDNPQNRYQRLLLIACPRVAQWVAEDKLMPGALNGYQYVEDATP